MMKIKKKVACLLAFAMLAASFGQFAFTESMQDVHAETTGGEPVYDATDVKQVLKHSEESVTIAASGSKDFGVTVPADETYYVSFTAKSAGSLWFRYRGTKNTDWARLLLDQNQYYVDGVSGAGYTAKALLKDNANVRVTIKSMPDKVSIWLNGEQVKENVALNTSAVGTPTVTWVNNAEATLTDVKIWKPRTEKDEPVYDATDVKQVLKHSEESVTIAASGSKDFGVTVPADETYYVSFTAKSAGSLWFRYRGTKNTDWARLLLDQNQYYVDGVSGAGYTTKALLKDNANVRVTIKSMPDKVSIWLDGELVKENVALNTSAVGTPTVTWVNNAEATLTDVKIWTEADASLGGYTATLDGNIGMNFVMNVDLSADDKASNNTYMLFTVPGETEQKVVLNSLGTDAVTDNWKYKFTCNVPAKKMSDTITAQFYVNGKAYSEEYTYSVAEYAKAIINDTTGAYSNEAKELAKAMLHYGAYSQKYFDYEETNLANSGLDETDYATKLEAVTADSFTAMTANNAKFLSGLGSNRGSSLVLDAETTLKLYFAPEAGVSVDNLQFTYGGETLAVSKVTSNGETWICIPIAKIAADKLGDTIEISVSDSADTSKSGTLKYSALTYGYNVLTNETYNNRPDLQNLVKALYLYNQAAVAYGSQQ